MNKIFRILAVVTLATFIHTASYAHCEVPCGIHTDHLRIELIKEHIMAMNTGINIKI